MKAEVKVVRSGSWKQEKPSWCTFSAYGVYRLGKGECEPDYHYHDCDEYFFVIDGKAKLLLEDEVYEIGPGDAVCIPKGGRHQIQLALEDFTLLWIYDELKGRKRQGHIPA